MQNNPNDRPKIIALSVAIGVVLLFVIAKAYMAFSAPSAATPDPSASAQPPSSAVTAASGSPALQVASASGANQQAGTGQMRFFDDQLDADPAAGQLPPASAGRGDAFRPIVAPVAKPPVVRISAPLPSISANNGPAFLPPVRFNAFPSGTRVGEKIPPRNSLPTVAPVEARLDGVVTGADSFAMLTIHEGSGSAGGEQTVFKRVGDRIAGYRITSLADNGITLRGFPSTWMVGQTRRVGEGLTAVATPAGAASPARVNAPDLRPNGSDAAPDATQDAAPPSQSLSGATR